MCRALPTRGVAGFVFVPVTAVQMLVLVRHAQSRGQIEKGFTGWTDTELTSRGVRQAQHCGRALQDRGFVFDLCYTSKLQRAYRSLELMLEVLGEARPFVVRTWRLNGRHYGELQGVSRADAIANHGRGQVQRWRHEYSLRPPQLGPGDPRLPSACELYADVDPVLLPRGESHDDADARVRDCWWEMMAPEVRAGRRVLVVSHNSTIRGLVKAIEGLTDAQVADFKLPTARPLVYRLDADLRPVSRYKIETRLRQRLQRLVARN